MRAHASGGTQDVTPSFDPPRLAIYWILLAAVLVGAGVCAGLLVPGAA